MSLIPKCFNFFNFIITLLSYDIIAMRLNNSDNDIRNILEIYIMIDKIVNEKDDASRTRIKEMDAIGGRVT